MAAGGGGHSAFPALMEPAHVHRNFQYLIVQCPKDDSPTATRGSLSNLNIFLVDKSIRACATVEEIKKNHKAGTYSVKVATTTQAKQLKDKLKWIDRTPVEVVDDTKRNQSRAVITCFDLKGMEPETIVEEMRSQGVIAAKHFKVQKGGRKEDSGSVLLTFNKSQLPEKVQVACYSLKPRLYVPAPTVCYQCYELGHISKFCKNGKRCNNCSGSFHGDGVSCTNPEKCLHCGGEHRTTNKNCPVWKIEKEVMEVKEHRNIPIYEARKIVEDRLGPASYSNVTASGNSLEQEAKVKSFQEEKQKWISELKKREEDLQRRELDFKKKEEESKVVLTEANGDITKRLKQLEEKIEESGFMIRKLQNENEKKTLYISALEKKIRMQNELIAKNKPESEKKTSETPMGKRNRPGKSKTEPVQRDRSSDSSDTSPPAPKNLAVEDVDVDKDSIPLEYNSSMYISDSEINNGSYSMEL